MHKDDNKTQECLSALCPHPCMNDIIIIDHVLFTHQLSDTKLWSKYCELNDTKFYKVKVILSCRK